MAILDSLIRDTAQRYGLGEKAGPFVSALLGLVTAERTGGLGGFLDLFRKAGLGDHVDSWIARGDNKPVTVPQLESALGTSALNGLASKVGISATTASSALAFLVPKIVDFLTPDGAVPSSLPSWVGSYLSGSTAVASGVRQAAATVADEGSSVWKWLLPLLILGAVGIFGYRQCYKPVEVVAEHGTEGTQGGEVAIDTPAVSNVPAFNSNLSMANLANKLKIGGTVTDEATKTKILDAIKAAFGVDGWSGDLTVDANAKPFGWLDKLPALLGAIKVPGVDLSFDGDALSVGGNLSDADKAKLMTDLKGVFGEGFSIGSFSDKAAMVAKEATAKAAEALAKLTGGSFSAADLVQALNLSIINFASGSAEIPADAQDLLAKAAEALKAAPAGTKIEIGGHTDSTGDAGKNLTLSQARAEAVKAALTKLGVDAAALTAKGYGGTVPVGDNDTEAGRFKNRRIAYTIAP